MDTDCIFQAHHLDQSVQYLYLSELVLVILIIHYNVANNWYIYNDGHKFKEANKFELASIILMHYKTRHYF